MSDIPLEGYADKIGTTAATPAPPRVVGNITYYDELVQGSDEWREARRGMMTASEMKLLITPTLKTASNDKERAHLYELLAQRITGYVEPTYYGDAMLRGHEDEILAVEEYGKHYAKTTPMGFIVNNRWGLNIGYSPDTLVGNDGQVEVKSRNQKLQIRALLDHVAVGEIDPDFVIQVQTGLLVSERKWCDLISYSGGLPMATVRVFPDEKIQAAILDAAKAFEERIAVAHAKFVTLMSNKSVRLVPTERRIQPEMV